MARKAQAAAAVVRVARVAKATRAHDGIRIDIAPLSTPSGTMW